MRRLLLILALLVLPVAARAQMQYLPGACPLAGCTFSGPITAPSGTFTGSGTGLAVTNNATVGGTLDTLNLAAPSSASSLSLLNAPAGSTYLTVGGSNNDIAPMVPIDLRQGWTWGTAAWGVSPIEQNESVSGSTTRSDASFGMFLQQIDNSSNTNNGTGILESLILNGSSVVGGRTGGLFKLEIAATTGNASAEDYTALAGLCDADAQDPAGTPAAYSGCFGFNATAQVLGNITWGQLVGGEIDVYTPGTPTISQRIGLQIVSVGSGGVQATNDDVALSLNNQYAQSASEGFKVGLEFGRPGGYFPIATGGTLIGAATLGGTMDAAYGIDLLGVTFSTASLALPGLTVDPTGNITIATPATGTATSYACFTSGGKIISSASAC